VDGIANHFPAKNALDCMILHIQSPHPHLARPKILVDPDTNLRLARQRFHCSCLRNDHWTLKTGSNHDPKRPHINSFIISISHREAGDLYIPDLVWCVDFERNENVCLDGTSRLTFKSVLFSVTISVAVEKSTSPRQYYYWKTFPRKTKSL